MPRAERVHGNGIGVLEVNPGSKARCASGERFERGPGYRRIEVHLADFVVEGHLDPLVWLQWHLDHYLRADIGEIDQRAWFVVDDGLRVGRHLEARRPAG